MAKQENPFINLDFQKMMTDFKMPGIDADALMNAQQKNIEAIASANQLAVEGMQAIGKRQAELFQQAVEESQKTLGELMTQGAPEDRIAKQAETVKTTIERTVTNLREISEMLAKSNQEAFEVINKRITESLEEVQSLAGKK
ncbi:phasin family protein [uncultured Nisaea sp.]|jgi:phasin family protein|uniref:phasin family protein n=1 Tax=uncultured Nisaea sp. TaxID=538215 RepID=UPI0030EE4863|tara:strand:+ start:398 stop:823 length:426 start_codon:yes stop_codon:yes gene_type:complete